MAARRGLVAMVRDARKGALLTMRSNECARRPTFRGGERTQAPPGADMAEGLRHVKKMTNGSSGNRHRFRAILMWAVSGGALASRRAPQHGCLPEGCGERVRIDAVGVHHGSHDRIRQHVLKPGL